MSLPAERQSDLEAVRLIELEGVIERGLGTFVEVGHALLEIRDSRLYRDSHGSTFEDYCRERWGFSRPRAYELMNAAEVVSAMADTPERQAAGIAKEAGGPLVPNERVARELAPLRREPEALRETWAEVVDLHGDKPTAAQVREVVSGSRECDVLPDGKDGVEPGDFRAALEPEPKAADRMAVHYSSATDEWATPQDFFDVLHDEFDFDLDVCALESSAKCARYFTPDDDGLAQTWEGTCWMNPPYGNEIGQWVRKAYESGLAGATVVCIVPARTDTAWWWDYAPYAEIRLVRGRLKFGGADTSAPFPNALLVFGRKPNVSPSFWWEWR